MTARKEKSYLTSRQERILTTTLTLLVRTMCSPDLGQELIKVYTPATLQVELKDTVATRMPIAESSNNSGTSSLTRG